jgi:hypothetical protein
VSDLGYVALVDVLGFREIINSDSDGTRISRYLETMQRVSRESGVGFVVFSDSIILASDGDDHESCLRIARACSCLTGELLHQDMALRGAIAFGQFSRKSLSEGVFVAGRAIVDAYEYEQRQNWVGVMLAPSAVKRLRSIRELCEYKGTPDELRRRIDWLTYIQRAQIPFQGVDAGIFDGFAVVPTAGRHIEPAELEENITGIIKCLEWLRSVSPSPHAQQKHSNTLSWLWNLKTQRSDVARLFHSPS